MTPILPKPVVAFVLALAAGLPAARGAETETTAASAQAPESIRAMLRGISGISGTEMGDVPGLHDHLVSRGRVASGMR